MLGRGRAQIAVQGDLSNGRGLMNVHTEHDTIEPTPEIGNASNFYCICTLKM
jgi:hypothetical protein